MKFVFNISRPHRLTLDESSSILPEDFSLREEDGQLLLIVEPIRHSSEEHVSNRVQQECDRIHFLTGEQLNPKLARIENPDGSGLAWSSLPSYLYGVRPLPLETDRQQWQTTFSVQLCLWRLAQTPDLPVVAKINLLFQIIEISFPNTRSVEDYPEYNEPDNDPHPRTEAKILRDLASHGKKQMGNPQIEDYCRHHGLSAESHDPTNAKFIGVLKKRSRIVEEEARKVIDSQITRKP